MEEQPEVSIWDGCIKANYDSLALMEWLQSVGMTDESAFFADDKILQVRSARDPIATLLLSGLDHIRMVTRSLMAQNGVLPFAHATPLRTALASCCTALWLMDGTSKERCVKSLQYQLQEQNRMLFFLETRQTRDPQTGKDWSEDHAEEVEQAEQVKTRIVQNWIAVTGTDRDQKAPADVKIMFYAGVVLACRNRSIFDGWPPIGTVVEEWKSLSGYAHGHRWQAGPHITVSEADGRYVDVTIVADMDWILRRIAIVLAAAGEACAMYFELSGSPE